MGTIIIVLLAIAIVVILVNITRSRPTYEVNYRPEHITPDFYHRPTQTTVSQSPVNITRTVYVDNSYSDPSPSLFETIVAAEIIEEIIESDSNSYDNSSFDSGGGDFGGGGSDSSW